MSEWNHIKRKPFEELSATERSVYEHVVSIKTFRYKLVGLGEKKVDLWHNFVVESFGHINPSVPIPLELMWGLDTDSFGAVVIIFFHATGPCCVVQKTKDGKWVGKWLEYGQMAVELTPVLPSVSEKDYSYYQALQSEAIASIPPYPTSRFKGRGIVIPGGGEKYFPCAWVCIHILRKVLHCTLPIELWYLGENEMNDQMIEWMKELDVSCINASDFQDLYPINIQHNWALKPYSIIHSQFEEIIFLDADNVPLRDPVFLFQDPAYQKKGSIFWPDFGRLGPERAIWEICGVPYRDEAEFESGQIVLHKGRVWEGLQLTMHYNEHADFYYRYINGDKDSFYMAWRKLNLPYSMPPFPLFPSEHTMCQHDFEGNIIFQHRNMDKWRLSGDNKHIEGFLFEEECLGFLQDLWKKWNGNVLGTMNSSTNSIQVSIITPTYRRSIDVLRRCLNSVRMQSLQNWEQIVCTDGDREPEVEALVAEMQDTRVWYTCTQSHKGDFANFVRNEMISKASGKYLVFLDDDNILFPSYLSKMCAALEANPKAGMAISQTLHFGPLPQSFGKPPKVLSGIPPKVQQIDTIQVMIKTDIMKKEGWLQKGYLSDGYTYEEIAQKYAWIEVPEVLSSHL